MHVKQALPCPLKVRHLKWNPSGAETRIFRENLVNAMAADALTTFVTLAKRCPWERNIHFEYIPTPILTIYLFPHTPSTLHTSLYDGCHCPPGSAYVDGTTGTNDLPTLRGHTQPGPYGMRPSLLTAKIRFNTYITSAYRWLNATATQLHC